MNALVRTNNQGQKVTTSLIVAEKFHKRHDHVLRDIANLSCSQAFRLANFGERDYLDTRGKVQPYYEMTKDGFTFLVMGYNGKEAAVYKERFITAFNAVVEIATKQDAILKNDDAIVALAFEIVTKRNKVLLEENEKQKQVIDKTERMLNTTSARLEAAAPKIEFTDRIVESVGTFPFNKAAKILQLPFGRNTLFEKLRNEKVLMSNNEPYQQYLDQGYFEYKHKKIEGISKETGLPFSIPIYQTYITGKGLFWLSKKYGGRNPHYLQKELVQTLF